MVKTFVYTPEQLEQKTREIARTHMYSPTLEAHETAFKCVLAILTSGQPQEIEEVTRQKNEAYAERNKLVCALSKLFPASLERHPDEDTSWDDDWRWIVFIDLPAGQATWHIHDSEIEMFRHLPRHTGREWDEHTTPEKYKRLDALKPVSIARMETESGEYAVIAGSMPNGHLFGYVEKCCMPSGWTESGQHLMGMHAYDLVKAEPTSGPQQEPPSHSRSCPLLNPMSDEQCTCGLEWRIQLQTEREMHNAWRKRAEEAEAKLAEATGPASQSAEPHGYEEPEDDGPCKTCGSPELPCECPSQPIPASGAAQSVESAWAILFDDADRNPEIFTGCGATEAAHKRFEQLKASWCCHLFQRVESTPARDYSMQAAPPAICPEIPTPPVTPVQSKPSHEQLMRVAETLKIRQWDQGDEDGFGGEYYIEAVRENALIKFWQEAQQHAAAPPVPHCPRCGSDKIEVSFWDEEDHEPESHYALVECFGCRESVEIPPDMTKFAQFFSPALPGKEQEGK